MVEFSSTKGDPEADPSVNAETVERYPDGRIPSSRRYIDYEGQVIVRTRYGTMQRWKKSGWDGGRLGRAPYILGQGDCRPSDSDPMNPELAADEFSVYYVEDNETVRYRVQNND